MGHNNAFVKGSEQSCIAMQNLSSGHCLYPVPTPHGAHTLAQTHSLTYMFPFAASKCALSSSGPCVFPGGVFSCPPFWDEKWAERDFAVGSGCLHSLWDLLIREMFRR